MRLGFAEPTLLGRLVQGFDQRVSEQPFGLGLGLVPGRLDLTEQAKPQIGNLQGAASSHARSRIDPAMLDESFQVPAPCRLLRDSKIRRTSAGVRAL